MKKRGWSSCLNVAAVTGTMQRADDVAGDALDVLLTFTEFQAFRGMLPDYRTEGGQGQDISSGTRW